MISPTAPPATGRRALFGLLFALAGTSQAQVATGQSSPDPLPAVEEISIADLQASMTAGRSSSASLVQAYLQRIDQIDRNGPTLNAIIELNPDALAIARSLDAERAAGNVRGALHGIPLLLKDNIDTADAMQTSAGSLAMVGDPATADSTVAARLRAAGAVILGKTNLSEWANFRGRRSSSGWSSRGGQTRNPYALERSPCGSSSGSGVAAAASLAAASIGTETDGSIVCPASVNGVVGIKPSIGLISRAGIVPIAASQDTAGPMARSVADAAVLLQAMVGSDARDPTTIDADHQRVDYLAALDKDALRGARLGVVRELAGYHAGVDARFEMALVALRAAGAELVDPVALPTRREASAAELPVLLHEFKHGLNAYLASRTGIPITSLTGLIAWNDREASRVLPWFGQEYLLQAEVTEGIDASEYLDSRSKAQRLAGPEGIDAALRAHDLDALVAPTSGPAWPVDWVNGDHYIGGSAGMAAIAGYPNISVPMGQVKGLPVGLSLFGAGYSEARLIALAYAFEQATGWRKPPAYTEGLSLK